jgi:hypothetical protein
MADQEQDPAKTTALPKCFIIMPFSDPDGYSKGHFTRVYKDILVPACELAEFTPTRADQTSESNLIHLEILKQLLEAPMCLCDLSSRNPNVLFELALRQAFDKPVALVEEVDTPKIFDVSMFRTEKYRKELLYHEVLQDQKVIANAIKQTSSGSGVNSIIRLLSLEKSASIPTTNAPEASADYFRIIMNELTNLRHEIYSRPRGPTGPVAAENQRNSLVGKWEHSVDGRAEVIELLESSWINMDQSGAVWRQDGRHLTLIWPNPHAPVGAWVDNCEISDDATTYYGTNQLRSTIRGTKIR